ncbi:MAG TPA: hypothetical protein VHB98_03780 [Chloroflexota bacterium]|jgi:hypothetical protein|nr:hypothetical protein [Chloroflexota bacterium]
MAQIRPSTQGSGEEDVDLLIGLLAEYSRRLRASVDLRYQSRRRRALASLGTTIVLFVVVVGVVVLPLTGIFNGRDSNGPMIILGVITALFIVFSAFTVMTMFVDEQRRSERTEQDIDLLASKLDQLIDHASAIEEEAIAGGARRLALALQLAEVEASMVYAGLAEYEEDGAHSGAT